MHELKWQPSLLADQEPESSTASASAKRARQLIEHEARSLLVRLESVRPFALQVPMVTAATISPRAQFGIERRLDEGQRLFRRHVWSLLHWLRGPEGQRATPSMIQRHFTLVRLRFNHLLSELDVFADALTQRAEQYTGTWLAGLDALAADLLALPGVPLEAPPVLCYLDRGMGAAIRRARTRLPTGSPNPVAIIRVPRERMVGAGIASSVAHEVGHQGAALLGLVPSLQSVLQGLAHGPGGAPWRLWGRWVSEMLADFWAVARVGVAGPLGLMGVVSLPRAFVFQVRMDDPHPAPWIRIKLACALGEALYPHPQWRSLDHLWETLYPPTGLAAARRRIFEQLQETLPDLVRLLVQHRPRSLSGRSLGEALREEDRHPDRLSALYPRWRARPREMLAASPSLVFATLGQARAQQRLPVRTESRLLTTMLVHWALRSAVDTSHACGNLPLPRGRPSAPHVHEEALVSALRGEAGS